MHAVLLAEVYPSLRTGQVPPGAVADAHQVQALATHFAGEDTDGALAARFAGPRDLANEERQIVESEEGWILGIEAGAVMTANTSASPRAYTYLKDAHAIYRRSFELIRQEVDLGVLPQSLHAVAERLIHACGCTAIQALLHCAKKHGLTAVTLDQRNSGDTAGTRGRVVGYGAYAFY